MTEYFGLSTVLDPERIVVTQSDLALFKRDRRLWFLRTYLGLRPRYQRSASPLVLGSMVHAALEQKYRDGRDLLAAYADVVAESRAFHEAAEGPFDVAGWTKQAQLGQRMLEGFDDWLESEHYDADIRVTDVEKLLSVETSYLGSPVVLTGKADLIVQSRHTGHTLIYDFKTSANIQRTIDQAYSTEQLPFYMTLQAALEPSTPVTGAAFYILLKSAHSERATGPFYHREVVTYTSAALATRRDSIHGTITDYVRVLHALHAGTSRPFVHVYPNPSAPTWDREFDPLIRVIEEGGHVDRAIADNYQQHSPYERYQPATLLPDD